MTKKKIWSIKPPPPPAPAAAAAARPGDVDHLVRALGSSSLREKRPACAHYNFLFRFPVIFNVAGPLTDGHMIVYADYLIPTLHTTRFNCSLSSDGLIATLTMELPRVYTDVLGRAEAGEHTARGADESL